MKRRVGIIGAGISGLVTAKVFLEDGFDVTVLEKETELGGVWASSRTYPGLHANNPRETYAYSDFPFPTTADEFPSAPQIRDYLGAYATRFGVDERIRFGVEVLRVAPADGRGWAVTTATRATARREETLPFDFVVVCNGVYSEPSLPAIDGVENFTGRVLHSSTATDPAAVAGKRVIVVGGAKSALDCAAFAAHSASECTLLYRRAHWMMPRYFPGRVRMDRILLTRASTMLLPYYRQGRFSALLHGPGRPLVRLWWRGLSAALPRLVRMPPELVPDRPLPAGFENAGVVHDAYDLVRAGRIRPVRGSLRRFLGGTTVELDNGERRTADLVIFATGWRQGAPFLADDLRRRVERDGRFHLYRLIVPPDVRGLGFIGYNSSTACQLTSEIAAHWLAQCFSGRLRLPQPVEMHREIDRFHRWVRDVFPDRSGGYFLGPHLIPYLDELMRDMGLSPRRVSNPWVERFAPAWPSRYAGVGRERRRGTRVDAEMAPTSAGSAYNSQRTAWSCGGAYAQR